MTDRYRSWGTFEAHGMKIHEQGEWIAYSDYEELEAEVDRLQRIVLVETDRVKAAWISEDRMGRRLARVTSAAAIAQKAIDEYLLQGAPTEYWSVVREKLRAALEEETK
jgi:hypothetical protein